MKEIKNRRYNQEIFDSTFYLKKWRDAGHNNNEIIKKFEELEFNLGTVFNLSYNLLYFNKELFEYSKIIFSQSEKYLYKISDDEIERRKFIIDLTKNNKPWDLSFKERLKNVPNLIKIRKKVKIYIDKINIILKEFFISSEKDVVYFPFFFNIFTPCPKIFFKHMLLSFQIYYYPLFNDDYIQFIILLKNINNEIFNLQMGCKEKIPIDEYTYAQKSLLGKEIEYAHIMIALQNIDYKNNKIIINKDGFFFLTTTRRFFTDIARDYCKKKKKTVFWTFFNNCMKDTSGTCFNLKENKTNKNKDEKNIIIVLNKIDDFVISKNEAYFLGLSS